MADGSMIFPIGFDLEKGIKDAGDDWDKKYAERLEKIIAKRPINVKLNLDTSKLSDLDAVKRRLAELKIEPITPETKAAIKELARELQALARALEAVSKYSVKSVGTSAVRGAKVDVYEAKAAAARELARARAAKAALAEEKLEIARLKAAAAANRGTAATRNLNREYLSQEGYVTRLIKRMVAYWSVHQVGNFLSQVREVTAEFELQRVSLGAIIQDQQRANSLFAEIKAFALQSPVSILDLTKYTKQLAAYKIGVDELFETTKRLTDVSVGLGVSMDRVVLAYGQTRATGHLRASEIRQFTEMGVPIVEELAAKLSDMNGELVTAAQVMDLVSKRAISFELVKEVFDDMTSAGGMFYNMQEKQGNTLFGMWAKLGDAASVMYEQIGNTESVNSAMKGTIQLLTDLMKNWREVGRMIGVASFGLATMFATKKIKGWQSGIDAERTAAYEKYIAASNEYRAALKAERVARATATAEEYKAIAAKTASAEATLAAARAEFVAVRNTTLLSKAWANLKAVLLGNWVTLLITALAAIGTAIYNNIEKAKRLTKALKEIKDEGVIQAEKSVYNFETLAKTAVQAADGTREQKEALEELKRTYRNIIPEQDLTIERLRAMNGEYTSLTNAIRQYIAQQTQQKQIDTIISETESKIINAQRNIKDFLSKTPSIGGKYGNGIQLGFSDEQIDKALKGMREIAKTTNDVNKIIEQAFKIYAGIELSNDQIFVIANVGKSKRYMKDFVSALTEQDTRIKEVVDDMSGATAEMGIFAQRWEETAERIKNTPLTAKENSFLYDKQKVNASIKEYIENLKDDFATIGLAWKNEWVNIVDEITDETTSLSTINFDAIIKEVKEKGGDYAITLGNAVATIQNSYNNLVPTNAIVMSVRSKFEELANSMKIIDKVKGNTMGATESLDDYRKKINDLAKDYAKQVENLTKILAFIPQFSKQFAEINKELLNAKNLEQFYSTMADLLGKTTSGSSGHQSDPRLGILQEMVSSLKQINKEYDDLAKKEGATKALEDTQRIYQKTFDNIQELSTKYKFGLPAFGVPTDTKTLTKYLDSVKKAMEKVRKNDKAVLALQVDIDKLNLDDAQRQIETELKRLSDKISRTKTAQEFYDKILSQTGDIDLAMNVTMSIFGDTGEGLFDNIVEQIRKSFTSGDAGIDLQITADIDAAIDTTNQRINYQKLAEIYDKYQSDIIEKNRSAAENIIKEGQKTAEANILTWEKELAKAKDYEQQRTDIINRETQRRAEIYKSNLPQEEKDRLAAQSRKRQDEDVAKVTFEEFTKSEDYIKIFENLDNTSTAALKRLREEMRKMIETNKELSPENMKTLVKAMVDIDEQISGRGFGHDMVQGVRDYFYALRDLKTAKKELKSAQAEYNEQLPQLDADIDAAKQDEIAAQEVLNALKAQEVQDVNAIVAAELQLNAATTAVTKAEQAKAKAAEKVKKAETKVTNQQDKQKKATSKLFKDLQQVAQTADQLASALGEVQELLGVSADSAAGVAFDSAIQGLQEFSKIMNVIIGLQTLYNIVTASNPWLAIASAVLAVGSILGSWISNNQVREANKEIEEQAELLERLEYTYSRLDKAAEKLFGKEYLANYKQQLDVLNAQAEAYKKQAEAEESKGKKADKEKLKEYENAARDTMDKIADMQESLAEKFLGTDLTSAARDFARAWLDSWKVFDNTADKMREKFREMIENMVVESMLARAMQRALEPVFKMIDEMEDADFDDPNFWRKVMTEAEKGATAADKSGKIIMQWAKDHMGFDPRGETSGGLKGISRDIASASEEQITGLAATMNTWSYYVSFVPNISSDVAAMRQILERDITSPIASPDGEWTDWQQQAMDNYIAIQRNTADTVVECRRIAASCAEEVNLLKRVITNNPSSTVYGVKVFA